MDVVSQVLKPQTEFRDKPVAAFETQAVERLVDVPQVLIEERVVEVPQYQQVEARIEELQPVIHEVMKEVPRYQVEYVEKVVEVSSQLTQEARPGSQRTTPLPRGSRHLGSFEQSFASDLQAPLAAIFQTQSGGATCLTLSKDSLRGSCVSVGTMQRRLAWPLRKDDTHNSGE